MDVDGIIRIRASNLPDMETAKRIVEDVVEMFQDEFPNREDREYEETIKVNGQEISYKASMDLLIEDQDGNVLYRAGPDGPYAGDTGGTGFSDDD